MSKTYMTAGGLKPLPIGNSPFERSVRSLLEKSEAQDMGKAILLARKRDGEAYNQFMEGGGRFTFERV